MDTLVIALQVKLDDCAVRMGPLPGQPVSRSLPADDR